MMANRLRGSSRKDTTWSSAQVQPSPLPESTRNVLCACTCMSLRVQREMSIVYDFGPGNALVRHRLRQGWCRERKGMA